MTFFAVGWVIVAVSTTVTAVMLMRNLLKNIEKVTRDVNETIEMMSDERSTAEGPGAG